MVRGVMVTFEGRPVHSLPITNNSKAFARGRDAAQPGRGDFDDDTFGKLTAAPTHSKEVVRATLRRESVSAQST